MTTMDSKTFRDIRRFMGLTQSRLSKALGYRHTIRVSEYERETNPVPVPHLIGHAVLLMGEEWHHNRRITTDKAVRKWVRHQEE